jgi:DNA-binding CsgD family transcriptional regulator
VSADTFRDYLKRIYEKLHARSRTEAALTYRAATSGFQP